LRRPSATHMETPEEKTKNLLRLRKATIKGDAAAVRALLESGNVDVNGVEDWVRLCSALRQTARDFTAEMAGAADATWAVSPGWKGPTSCCVIIIKSFAGHAVPCEDRPRSQRSEQGSFSFCGVKV
jgi:hypothetical protein